MNLMLLTALNKVDTLPAEPPKLFAVLFCDIPDGTLNGSVDKFVFDTLLIGGGGGLT